MKLLCDGTKGKPLRADDGRLELSSFGILEIFGSTNASAIDHFALSVTCSSMDEGKVR